MENNIAKRPITAEQHSYLSNKYWREIEPYLQAISKINDLYFAGWVLSVGGAVPFYKDGHKDALKPYEDQIEKIRNYIFRDYLVD